MDSRPVEQDQTIEAMNQNVVVEIMTNADEFAKRTMAKSGILMPSKMLQGTPNMGRVVSISKEIKDPGIKLDDVVAFALKKDEVFFGFKLNGMDLTAIDIDRIAGIINYE